MSETLTNMKVEDRLAEKLKGADFAQWFGEDDLRELTAKALDIAFFKNREVRDGSYSTKTLPPLIAETAVAHVKTRMDELVLTALREKLAEQPEVLADIVKAAVDRSLEDIVLKAISSFISGALAMKEWDIQNRIQEMLKSR